jgi:hypothetical protein
VADSLTNAEKARILVDGENPETGAIFSTDPSGVVSIDDPDGDGNVYLHGVTTGDVLLTVTEGTRSGSETVTVTDAPLVVTLDTPIPA